MSRGPDLQSRAVRFSMSGHGADAAARAVDRLYAGQGVYCRPVTESVWFKFVGIGDAQLSMRRLQLNGYLRGNIATDKATVVQWLSRGRGRTSLGAAETSMELGSAPTVLPIGRRFQIEYENVDQRLVHVHEDLLRDIGAEQQTGDMSLAAHVNVPADTAGTIRWRASVTRAVAAFRADGPASPSWQEAKRDIARTLLGLYPLPEEPDPAGSAVYGDARLQSALDYLHNRVPERVTVADVAAAAGVSVRGLQERFQQHLQRTPMQYERELRLDLVHAQLQAPNPAGVTVGDVAHQCGFGHLGRFSAAYTERFGQYPHKTLRDHRRSHQD